jgi:predicted HD phosphohydrolase
MAFFEPATDGLYGTGLSQTSHGLQTAWHAERGGFDSATIVAGLLHDVGWKLARPSLETTDHGSSNSASQDSAAAAEGILAVCADQIGLNGGAVSAEQQKAQHDVIGSTWLQMRGFEYKVAHLVEGHVLAKRYLTGTDAAYFELLEQDSVRTLKFQGGPMNEEEARVFEGDSLFEECVQMRRWDEGAKVVGLDTPGWDHFKEAVFANIAWAPCSADELGDFGGRLAFVRDGNTIVAPAHARM